MIGTADGILVMLDYNQGVSQVSQLFQGLYQPGIVPLVQAYGGLVQDVEDAGQVRAYLGGQTNALRLPSREAACVSGEGQVSQAHVL